MMQSESAGAGPPKLYRPFRFYDPEVLAIMTILVGLFQVLLGVPTYYMSQEIHMLYICPVFVGAVHVTGGSLAFVCERSPSRQWLKNCMYCTLGGLLVGLIATTVYGYAFNEILSLEPCESDQPTAYGVFHCARDDYVDFFRHLTAVVWVYDIAAVILQSFLSFSAMKGLRRN